MKSIFPPSITLDAIRNTEAPFAETLGLRFTELGADYLKGEVTIDKRHLRPGGIMNGGVTLGVIETVGSTAARCVIHGQSKNSLGIQVNASHLLVASPGDTLTATARPIHLGRSTHLWDVNIENQNGRLVCTGRITLMVVAD